MKPLSKYILESFERFYKLSEADKAELLKLDVEYHILFEEFCQEQVHFMNVANSDEEIKRICDLYNKGKDFELNIKYEKSKFEDDDFCKKLW